MSKPMSGGVGAGTVSYTHLTAQEWQLKEMSGLSSKPEKMPTLLFTDSTALYGFAGCNRFFGTYTPLPGRTHDGALQSGRILFLCSMTQHQVNFNLMLF